MRSADVCKKIKLRHGLTFGNSSGEKVNRDRLRPVQKALFDIKTAAIAAADRSSSWGEFQRELEAQGIEACFSFNRKTGDVRGISFAKGDFRFAGSKLSKQKLTYGKLAAKLGELPNMGEGVYVLQTPSRNQRLTTVERAAGAITESKNKTIEGVLPNSTPTRNQQIAAVERVTETMNPTESSETNLIPLSVIIDLLMGPTVVESTGGGGTSNDLDWNDERRRLEEARENQYIHKPFKRRR